MQRWLAVAVFAAACGQATDASAPRGLDDDPPVEPPEPPHLVDPAAVIRGMHLRFDELHRLERLLVAGDLKAAKVHAAAIATAPVDTGLNRWAAQVVDVQAAARSVGEASTVNDALVRETHIAAACGECHIATGSVPRFRSFPRPPPETAVMARHQWAVDRLWEGMVGAAEEPWVAGLAEIARVQPPQKRRDQQELAVRLQRLAVKARATLATDLLDDRARIYGDLLVTCAGCHATR